MNDLPLLSLCMIVRDAAAELPRCLQSVRGLVDEVVVVDTGSEDDSIAVAESHGARVLQVPWQDDFAAARNVGLDQARGRWILFLDADEYLDLAATAWIREELERDRYLGFYLPVISQVSDLEGDVLEAWILRIFRASPRVRFRYPIHEQVLEDLMEWSKESSSTFARLEDATVRHEGYRPAHMERYSKIERNLRIFAKALREHPDNSYLHYKYADFLRSVPEHKGQGLHAAEQAYHLVRDLSPEQRRSTPYLAEVFAIYCASLLENERRSDALQLLRLEPPEEWRSPHYDYVAALALDAAGDLEGALQRVTQCCEGTYGLNLTARRPGIVGHLGESLRARLWLKKGDGAKSEAAALRALKCCPTSKGALHSLADALFAQGNLRESLRVLHDGIRSHPGRTSLALHSGLLLLQARLFSQAVAMFRRVEGQERVARIAGRVLDDGHSLLAGSEERVSQALRKLLRGERVDPAPVDPAWTLLAPLLSRVRTATAPAQALSNW